MIGHLYARPPALALYFTGAGESYYPVEAVHPPFFEMIYHNGLHLASSQSHRHRSSSHTIKIIGNRDLRNTPNQLPPVVSLLHSYDISEAFQ